MSIGWVEWARFAAPVDTPGQVNVLTSLAWHADADGFAFPSASLIAAETCMTRRGVQLVLRELEDQELIENLGPRMESGGVIEYALVGDAPRELGELSSQVNSIHGRARERRTQFARGAKSDDQRGALSSPKRLKKGPRKVTEKGHVDENLADPSGSSVEEEAA